MGTLGSNYPAQTIVVTPDTTYGDSNAEKFQTAITISASEVSMIYSNGSNAVLMVRGTSGTSSDRYTSVYAQGTAASYAAQSGQHVALTRTDDSVTFYMNADLFKTVADYTSGPSTSIVAYGTESGVNNTVQVNGTAAAIAALFEVAIPDDVIPVVAATAGTTITSTANALIVRISGAPGANIVLPAATAGRIIYFVNTVASTFVLDAKDVETIDGSATTTLSPSANLALVCAATGAWESIVTQVGSVAKLSVEQIEGVALSGIDIQTVDNDIFINTTGTGDVILDATATGDAIIRSTGTGGVYIDGGGTLPVDIAGLSMNVPDGGVFFQTGTTVGLTGDGVGDEFWLGFNNTYPVGLTRSTANAAAGISLEGSLFLYNNATITGAADPGAPLTRIVNKVTTNAATHGVLLDASSSFVIIQADAGVAADVQVRSALGVVVTTVAAGVTKLFVKFGGTWSAFTL